MNFMNTGSIKGLIASIGRPNERPAKKGIGEDKLKYVNPKLCTECGGACCKRCGCEFSPDDFSEISFETLKNEIEKGYISIDFAYGEEILRSSGVYFLRARNAGRPIVDTEDVRGSGCILLTDSGCKLDYEQRPSGGRLLIPAEEKKNFLGENTRICKSDYKIEECCDEWIPFQEIIGELINYFKDKDFPCSI